jgi:hypothetical protein
MDVVMEDYLRFLRAGPEPGTGDDTKAFAGHHAACRAALAHVEALVKLGRLMGAEGSAVEDAATILVEARQAIAAFPEEDPHGEEEQC